MKLARRLSVAALWSFTYNYVWGVAWFLFMRGQWCAAASSLHRRMPWTAEVWFAWITVTIPIGILVVAYADDQKRHPSIGLAYATLAIWCVMVGGFSFLEYAEGYGVRVLALDAAVNLVGMGGASLLSGTCLALVKPSQPLS